MRQKSPALTVLKLVLMILICFFLAMIWWSTNLVEQGVHQLSRRVEKMENTLQLMKCVSGPALAASKPSTETGSFPNLLTEDPFYKDTLPGLLGPNFKYTPIWHTASLAKPNNLGMFSGWAEVSNWNRLCSGFLGDQHFGIWDTLGPGFATRMEERPRQDGKGTEYWVYLRQDLFWKALNPALFPPSIKLAPHFLQEWRVTADDYLFFWQALMNPFNQESRAVTLREYLGDIESFDVIDDFTFVVRWKSKVFIDAEGQRVYRHKYLAKQLTAQLLPFASFVYKYYPDGTKIVPDDGDKKAYIENSTFAQALTEHWAKNYIVSCGPYEFGGMTDEAIRFKRNVSFYDPYQALRNELDNTFRGNPSSIWNDFKEGKLPVHTLSAQELSEWERFKESSNYQEQKARGEAVYKLEYLARIYGYIGWNLKRPLFASQKVRQALTMAIDRRRIIDQILNGQAVEITGTFFKNSPSTNPELEPWPFDPEEAKRLLAEEGFVLRSSSGVLEKEINGEWIPFKFKINYYVNNETFKSISSYMVTALKEIGISVETHGLDLADLTSKMDDKDFDAILMLWSLGAPPEDPRQLWHSKGAKDKGSSNFISFQNPEADSIIEELEYATDPTRRRELYWRFGEILHEEQPYVFLFTPKINLLYREYVKNVFIPADRQDLIPGANVREPQPEIFWIDRDG